MFLNVIKSLWLYREFILGSVKREFQLNYQRSMLGIAWSIANPLSMILVYTVIFSQLMKAKLPGIDGAFGYSIYLCSGIVTWGLFAELTRKSIGMFIEHANLIKKINFPRLCLPVIITLNSLLNFSIIFSIFLLFIIISGNFPGYKIVAVLPISLVLITFAMGLGLTLGVLNVFFRDVGQLFNILTQLWFWGTPIVYPINILPESIQFIVGLNPMTIVMSSYQNLFVMGAWPSWTALSFVFLLGLFFCSIALVLFKKHAGEIVDEV
ncbi:ABC transporter permease [Vibrio sp. JC009]|uniref:ABC transporter permease n=1 Tax=Vibrio sp. JC009 TaxID=2912314 RepID=UPI0023B1E905|nr:ABC transporter permease [Vibrio sp. JC009]WED21995.1 ABC transporter permease [Vibrio sp. JC009]